MSAPAATAPLRAPRRVARLDELLGREVSLRALALLRVLVGPIVLLHLAPFLSDSLHGRTYQDVFHEPYASWYPELPEGAYIGVLWLGAAAAVAMSLGALARLATLTRVATVTTFAVVAYNLFLSTTHFHNNRAYLVIVLGVLAMAPVAQAGPAWPLWLLRFECAAVYGASGLSKLLDPDWFGGTVTWQRVTQARARPARASGLGRVAPHRPRLPHRRGQGDRPDRAVHRARAVVAAHALRRGVGRGDLPPDDRGVGVRAGLLVPRHRRAPDLGGAVHARPGAARRSRARRSWRVVRALDWLARFRVEPAPPGSGESRSWTATARRSAAGPRVAFALSRLPLTAWFALPTLLLPAVRRARAA